MRAISFIAGMFLVSLVPIAIALPGIPGDILLVTGLVLMFPKLAHHRTMFKKHWKILSILGVTWTILFWSSCFLMWRVRVK